MGSKEEFMSIKAAVADAMDLERDGGKNVEFHPLRISGKEFAEGYEQFLLIPKKNAAEKRLFLNYFRTFEAKHVRAEIHPCLVERIRREIREFWDAPDEEVKRLREIS
jgi:hypothetical protein